MADTVLMAGSIKNAMLRTWAQLKNEGLLFQYVLGASMEAGSGLSPRAARRLAMRKAGIPTSQQPLSQASTRVPGTIEPGGRQYTYTVPAPGGGTRTMSVQHSLTDRVAGHGPHWEAGPIKTKPVRVDPLGRPRIENGKVKINE